MNTTNKTIVAFHTSRGGRYNNPGFNKFIGDRKISDFTDDLFLMYENERDIFTKIGDRDNLKSLAEKAMHDDDNAAIEMLKSLGFNPGEKVWFDGSGHPVGLTFEESESGVGVINIDNDYNTTSCIYLKDCDKEDLQLIVAAQRDDLIREYFNECAGLYVNWNKFDDDQFMELIEAHFSGYPFDVEDFYLIEENK